MSSPEGFVLTKSEAIDAFIETSRNLSFATVNGDFVEFLPATPGRILDAGAGAGQNAAALARRLSWGPMWRGTQGDGRLRHDLRRGVSRGLLL